jgi:hypothetical protein
MRGVYEPLLGDILYRLRFEPFELQLVEGEHTCCLLLTERWVHELRQLQEPHRLQIYVDVQLHRSVV